jgi:hypothetical protein
MNPEEVRKTAEDLLDERRLEDALASYGSAEPRVGFEMRILANLHARAAERQRRWIYMFAGAVAAVVFAIVIVNRMDSRSNAPANETSQTLSSHANSTNGERKIAARQPETRAGDHSASAPKKGTGSRSVLVATEVKQSSGDKQLFAQNQPALQNHSIQSSSLEQQSVIRQEHTAPEIYVSDLKAIQPIEIRELPPVKEIN